MTTLIDAVGQASNALRAGDRRLLVIWQNPATKTFTRVGRLTERGDGSFEFSYVEGVDKLDGFRPISGFPRFGEVYASPTLSAFFANRVMSADRENFHQYLQWIGLNQVEPGRLPVELLVRTGGGRATDLFHIVEEPDFARSSFVSRFFVSGLWHADRTFERVAQLSPGDLLLLRPDVANPVNPFAIYLEIAEGEPIGWVPDWLCGELSFAEAGGYKLAAEVERVSVDAPNHLRVLCRVTAERA